jgi:hypothetical protein
LWPHPRAHTRRIAAVVKRSAPQWKVGRAATRCLELGLRAGRPACTQVNRCIRMSGSDREFPALTGRSGAAGRLAIFQGQPRSQAGAARVVHVKLPVSESCRKSESATRRQIASASRAGRSRSTHPNMYAMSRTPSLRLMGHRRLTARLSAWPLPPGTPGRQRLRRERTISLGTCLSGLSDQCTAGQRPSSVVRE